MSYVTYPVRERVKGTCHQLIIAWKLYQTAALFCLGTWGCLIVREQLFFNKILHYLWRFYAHEQRYTVKGWFTLSEFAFPFSCCLIHTYSYVHVRAVFFWEMILKRRLELCCTVRIIILLLGINITQVCNKCGDKKLFDPAIWMCIMQHYAAS